VVVVAKKSRGSKDRQRVSTAQEWTSLEKGLAVLLVVFIVATALLVAFPRELYRLGTIESRIGEVDLTAGGNRSSYQFDRELKEGYQVVVRYQTVDEGPAVHFKLWNQTTDTPLLAETTAHTLSEQLEVPRGDAGVYTFKWWVEGGTGTSRVHVDVLIEPTEELVV